MVKKVSRLFLVTIKKTIRNGLIEVKVQAAPVATHSPGSPVIQTGKREATGSKIRLPNGNYLEETAYYYVMVENKQGGYSPALITMKSTQLSVSKKWNSMMKSVQIDDGKGGFAVTTNAWGSLQSSIKSTKERQRFLVWLGCDDGQNHGTER